MPPGSGFGFEDRDLVADLHQVVRHGQAGDARADHRDLLVVAAIRAAACADCSLRGECRKSPRLRAELCR